MPAGVRGGAVVIGHHTRREGKFGVDIAIDQGQADDLVRLNGPAQYRVRRIDQRGSLSDRDGLSRRTHGQRDINRQRLVHVEGDILLHKAFKAGSLRLDGVPANGKVIDAVFPIAVCRRRPGEPGIQVGCLHGRRVDHRALLILHRPDDGPGNLLSKRGDAARENKDERHELLACSSLPARLRMFILPPKSIRFRFV